MLLAAVAPSAVFAGEAQLKNGLIVSGNMWLLDKLAGRPVGRDQKPIVKDADPVSRNIVLIGNDWQKTYVPRQQIPFVNPATRSRAPRLR